MLLGLSLHAFTVFHVVISLVAIAAGFVVFRDLLHSARLAGWNTLFLLATIATSVTGFLFPPHPFGPPDALGVLSLVILGVALLALHAFRLVGAWRWIYVCTALLALYLNCFVAVVQSFQKVPFLHPFAPTQTEPAFAVAQALLFIGFAWFGARAVRRFRPSP